MSYRLVDLGLPRVSGELAREQWVLSPEQIAAGGWLLCQTSHVGQWV
jgi:hypothetical protein